MSELVLRDQAVTLPFLTSSCLLIPFGMHKHTVPTEEI